MSDLPAYNQVYVVTQDTNGRRGCNHITWQNHSAWMDASLDSLASAYQACVDTKLVAVQAVLTKSYTPTVAPGPYNTFFDRANFATRFADATSGNFNLVGPKQSIFDASHQIVDMSNSNVIALVTALMAVAQNAGGSPLAAITRGTRTKVNPYPP